MDTKIVEKHGWLPYSKVGKKAADALFYVVQHSNIEGMKKYLPVIKKEAAKGEASKKGAAMMEDRILMNSGKKQVYGTQAMSFNKKGQAKPRLFIWPIEDVKNVNKRRKEIGFKSTIEEQAKNMGADFDPNEPLPDVKFSAPKKKKKSKK